VNNDLDNEQEDLDKTKKKKKKPKKEKVKKVKPVYNEYIYSPALQVAKPVTLVLGFVFRALIVYTMTLGMTLFICDAFKVTANTLLLMGIALLPVGIFSVMCLSRKLFWAGLGVTVAGLAGWMLLSGNPVTFLLNSVGTLWNHMLDRLDTAGYRVPALYLPVDSGGFYTTEEYHGYIFNAVILMMVIFAAFYAAVIISRVRFVPFAIVSGVLLTAIFTYNLNSSNWGFALIIASICGVLSMKMYDGMYNTGKFPKGVASNINPADPRQKGIRLAAGGGYVGLVSLAVSMLILFIPALSISEQWSTIEFISEPMAKGRAIVSSVIAGENPDIDMGFLGNLDTLNSRDTSLEARTFTGRPMLEVYASFNMPLYLRSWVAGEYDNDGNSWSSVPTSKAKQYEDWFYSGFSPEVIHYNYLNLINPKLTRVNSFTSHSEHIDEGFVTETIDVVNIDSSGNLLFTGTTYNPEYGLMEFLSTDQNQLYSEEWKFYYEGIVTSSWLNFNKQYRMVSFVTSYRSDEYEANLRNNLAYYDLMKYYITQYAGTNLTDEQKAAALDSAKAMLALNQIEYTEPTALERYFALSPAEQEEFVYNYFALEEYSAEFVETEYLTAPDSKVVEQVAETILQDMARENAVALNLSPGESIVSRPDVRDTVVASYSRHDAVMKVIDYLKENYTYTLTPTVSSISSMSALDSFLYETKEGYCVQFATAATMLLREMGIPARYVEGYYLSSLRYDDAKDRVAKYYGTARDYNAHAWIEVYMGPVGWMLYETTPAFYSDLYEPLISGSSSSNPNYTPPTYTEPEIPEIPEEEILEEEEPGLSAAEKYAIALAGAGLMLVIIVVGIPLLLLWRSHEKAIHMGEQRAMAINRALKSQLDEGDLREVSRQLNDAVWQLHQVADSLPKTGELPAEYAERIDDTINDSKFSFRDILMYMNAEEFGDGMARWQLREEAEYVQVLWDKLTAGMTKTQMFYYRTIKRLI